MPLETASEVWESVVSVDINAIINWKPNADVLLPFGKGMDTLLAFNLGWVVSSCEFTRYAKTGKNATVAPALGLLVAGWWFIGIGTFSTIAVASTTGVYDPNMSDPSSLAAKLGMGWVAFLVIIMSTVTANLISIYVASYSLMNIAPKLKFRPAAWIVGLSTILVGLVPIFIGSFYDAFNIFLDYIGVAFPPLIAVLVVDYYIIRKKKYDMAIIGDKQGAYWYKNGINWYGIISWLIGATTFVLLKMVNFLTISIGAVIPSMIISGILYYFLAKAGIKNRAYKDMMPMQSK